MSHKKTVVPLIDRVGDLVRNLNGALQARDAVLMAALYGELTSILERAFAGDDYSFRRLKLYCEASLCSIRYKIFNNMNGSAAEEGRKTVEMLDAVIAYSNEYSDDEMARLREIRESVRGMVENLPPHKNRVVNRLDSCCRLCRVRPANKTGSHMVPNFLAHPSFSWDGKGKRDHEALNHDFMNAPEANCTFYGREVPEWRFAQGEGKSAVTEADVAANINQLEFDNEFCSMCEGRFGILESAYSQYYNGVQRSVDPRVAYLFWLSVLWRMSIGSIGIFMGSPVKICV